MSETDQNGSNLKQVKEALKSFLIDKKSENFVLTGDWGTGKTWLWKDAVAKAQRKIVWSHRGSIIAGFWFFIAFILSEFFPIETLEALNKNVVYICLFLVSWFISFVDFVISLHQRNKILARGQYAYVSTHDCESLKELKGKIIEASVKRYMAGQVLKPFKTFYVDLIIPAIGTACFVFVLSVLMFFILPLLAPLFLVFEHDFLEFIQPLSTVLEFFKKLLQPFVRFVSPLLEHIKFVEGSFTPDQLQNLEDFLCHFIYFRQKVFLPALISSSLLFAVITAIFVFFRSNQKYWRLRNSIICIDDIERANKLNPQDILHLAADLRDNNNCKVALILNDDLFCDEDGNLKPEKSKAWKVALEKGSDRHFRLRLSSEDAVKVALEDKDGWKERFLKCLFFIKNIGKTDMGEASNGVNKGA